MSEFEGEWEEVEVEEAGPEEAALEVVDKGFDILMAPTEEDLDKNLKIVEHKFEVVSKIRELALKKVSPHSITDHNNRPYISADGVMRFQAPFGIYEKDVKGYVIKDNGVSTSLDDPEAYKGKFQAIMYEGIIGSKTLGVECSFKGGVFLDSKQTRFHDRTDYVFYTKKALENWFFEHQPDKPGNRRLKKSH